jgi:integrase
METKERFITVEELNTPEAVIDKKVLRARERARVHSTRHRGLVYRLKEDGTRTYLGFADGRRVRLNATTERDAVSEYSELRGAVAKGSKVPPANLRFQAVAEEWLEQKGDRLRPHTKANYRASLDNELLPKLGTRRLREITVDDIARLIRKWESEGKATSTINNHLKPVSGTFKYALRRGLVSVNPVALLTVDDRPKKVEKVKAYEWTTEEIRRLFAAADRHSPEHAALFRTAVNTGLRLGELLGLQWKDIDIEGRVLTVERQLARHGEYAAPKTPNALRRIPLTPEMLILFRGERAKALAKGHASPESPVFATAAGGTKMHRTIQRSFENVSGKANLPEELSFHDLRHAFASIAAHAGVDSRMLSELMGHSHAVTTERYTHLYNRESQEDAFRQAMSSQSW